jgi:hypothetical protein
MFFWNVIYVQAHGVKTQKIDIDNSEYVDNELNHHHVHGLGFLKACSGFKISYKSCLKLNNCTKYYRNKINVLLTINFNHQTFKCKSIFKNYK